MKQRSILGALALTLLLGACAPGADDPAAPPIAEDDDWAGVDDAFEPPPCVIVECEDLPEDSGVEGSAALEGLPGVLGEQRPAEEFITIRVQDEQGVPVPYLTAGLHREFGDAVSFAPLAAMDYSLFHTDENGEIFYWAGAAGEGEDTAYTLTLTALYDSDRKQEVEVVIPAAAPATVTAVWQGEPPPREQQPQTRGLRMRIVDGGGNPVQGVELSGSPYPLETEGAVPSIAIILGPSDAEGVISWEQPDGGAGTYVLHAGMQSGEQSERYEIQYTGEGLEEVTLTWSH